MAGSISHFLLLIGVIFSRSLAPAQSDNPYPTAAMRSFERAYQIVKENYAEPIDNEKAIYGGAIPGMLRVLDPHSRFLDAQEYALLQHEESGERFDLGIRLAAEGSMVVVAATIPDTPGQRAGIRPGDRVVAINGRPTTGLASSSVAEMLNCATPTEVRLSIKRANSSVSLTVVVRSEKFKAPSVQAFVISPGVAYLRISEFDQATGRELKQALKHLGKLNSLILDLRENPGGLLESAVEVADQFLPKGALIGSLVERSTVKQVYRARHGNNGRKYPIVVLVDRATASAAEFVAGVLQDQDRALVLGQNTFGKGMAQTILPLSENTALALTTDKVSLPSGRFTQRPYAGISEIDYYYRRPINSASHQVSYTCRGRTVYGGAGISPDIVLPVSKQSRFAKTLLRRNAVVGFSAEYVAHHRVDKYFEVSRAVLQEFYEYLGQHRILGTTDEIDTTSRWLRTELSAGILTAAFGPEEGLRVRAKNDVEVLSAIEFLPAAARLASTGN